MTGQPRVSVIMPFLDSARFIAESIDSVRAQSFADWELLLCDDGSTDGSTAIARRFAEADPLRVRWLEHEGHARRGASAARNLGLKHARGELIAFLDADDVWLPDKLSDQVALLDARPDADALCGSSLLWYGWTGRPEDSARDRVLPLGPPHGSLWPPPTFLAHRLRGRAASPATCSLIVRHDAVRRSGGFEESFERVYTDQAFYAKLFLRASLLVVETCWDRYRQHSDSACASESRAGRMDDAKLRYLLWLEDYLTSAGVTDRRLRGALRSALWGVRHPRSYAALRTVRHAARGLRAAPGRLVASIFPRAR
jgi:glycosyltransferase involved in cell wall biosynthesis